MRNNQGDSRLFGGGGFTHGGLGGGGGGYAYSTPPTVPRPRLHRPRGPPRGAPGPRADRLQQRRDRATQGAPRLGVVLSSTKMVRPPERFRAASRGRVAQKGHHYLFTTYTTKFSEFKNTPSQTTICSKKFNMTHWKLSKTTTIKNCLLYPRAARKPSSP